MGSVGVALSGYMGKTRGQHVNKIIALTRVSLNGHNFRYYDEREASQIMLKSKVYFELVF